jgi:hypothetical protein
MVRFHIWFLVVVLVGGPLAAGYFLGFDAFEAEALRAAEAAVSQDAARAEARSARLAEERVREAAQLGQRAAVQDELLPLAAGSGSPLVARDRIKAALERVGASGDLVVVADVRGTVVLRTKDAGEDFNLGSLRDALRGLPRTEVVGYRGALYEVASAPVMAGQQVVGAVALGYKAASDWVEKLRGDRDSGIAVFLDGKILAATLAAAERRELEGKLKSLKPGKAHTVALVEDRFLVQLRLFPGLSSAGLVHIRSARTALSGVSDLQLRYLYVAGGAFLVAVFWGFLLQRTVSRPAGELIARVKAAADTGTGTVASGDLPKPWSEIGAAVSSALLRTRARVTDVAAARAEAAAAVARAEVQVAEAKSEVEAVRAEARAFRVPGASGEMEVEPVSELRPGIQVTIERPPEAPPPAEVLPAPEPLAPPPLPEAEVEVEPLPLEEILVQPAEPPLAEEGVSVLAAPRGPTVEVLFPAVTDPIEAALQALHEEFLKARRKCSESTDEVTFERFSKKVRRVRQQIREHYQCRDVQFDVYVRDGRAALRAQPLSGVEGSPTA